MHLTLGQVSDSMKKARSMWRKRATKTYALHLYEQLAKLDELEAAAWIGWERSLKDELQTGTEDGETPMGAVSKTTVRRRNTSGNATFLKVIQDAVRQRCELLGLLDPETRNGEATQPQGQVVSIVIDTREEAEKLQSLSFDQYANLISPESAPAEA